jgi:hypothetical protein
MEKPKKKSVTFGEFFGALIILIKVLTLVPLAIVVVFGGGWLENQFNKLFRRNRAAVP